MYARTGERVDNFRLNVLMGNRFLRRSVLGAEPRNVAESMRTCVRAWAGERVYNVRLDVLMGSRFLGRGVFGVENWNVMALARRTFVRVRVSERVDDARPDVSAVPMGSRVLGWSMLGADAKTRVYARTSERVDDVRLNVLMGNRFLRQSVLGAEPWNAAESMRTRVYARTSERVDDV